MSANFCEPSFPKNNSKYLAASSRESCTLPLLLEASNLRPSIAGVFIRLQTVMPLDYLSSLAGLEHRLNRYRLTSSPLQFRSCNELCPAPMLRFRKKGRNLYRRLLLSKSGTDDVLLLS